MGPSFAGWLGVMSFQIYLDAESVLLPVCVPWTPPHAPHLALTIDSRSSETGQSNEGRKQGTQQTQQSFYEEQK